jgi:hypothetical protein
MTYAPHCHLCGGVIPGPSRIEYRPPRTSAMFALRHGGHCECARLIAYEDSPLVDPARPDDGTEA